MISIFVQKSGVCLGMLAELDLIRWISPKTLGQHGLNRRRTWFKTAGRGSIIEFDS